MLAVNLTPQLVNAAPDVMRGLVDAENDVLLERFRHDLRQPLAAVSMLVYALAHADDLQPPARRQLAEVRRQVDWALDLLRDEEEGLVQIVDIGETIADHCTAGAGACVVSFVQATPARVAVNPVELTRVVRNLLDNAIRASGAGGCVEVMVDRDEADAVLEVSDSGPGFGRLAPVHCHGLVGVRRFVERYGGRLLFGTSSLGGAAVTLRLPLTLGDTTGRGSRADSHL